MRIRRSPSAAWREIDGQVAIVSTDVNRVRLLNAVGSFVWANCDEKTVDELVDSIVSEYGVARDTAAADVIAFVEDLRARGMIEVEGAT